MRRLHLTLLTIMGILLGLSSATDIWSAQQPISGTVPVSTVVSVEAKHGKDIPAVEHKEDVRVLEGRDRLQVTDWIPLQGSEADLELLILIDEETGQTVALQFDDLRRFMNAQPPTTAIAIGYMEYGTVRMAQNFTKDHDASGQSTAHAIGRGGSWKQPVSFDHGHHQALAGDQVSPRHFSGFRRH